MLSTKIQQHTKFYILDKKNKVSCAITEEREEKGKKYYIGYSFNRWRIAPFKCDAETIGNYNYDFTKSYSEALKNIKP